MSQSNTSIVAPVNASHESTEYCRSAACSQSSEASIVDVMGYGVVMSAAVEVEVENFAKSNNGNHT